MDAEQRIRALALFSAGRAYLFGLAAISIVTLGAWSHMSIRAGAILLLLLAAVQTLSAVKAGSPGYSSNELGRAFGQQPGFLDSRSKALFGQALRSTYLKFARFTLTASVLLYILELSLERSPALP